jgi:hypothetical protein
MRSVLAHDNDHERFSVVRATAIALGLPLLVLETIEGLDFLESPDQATGTSPGALVLVVRPAHGATTLLAKPRLAVARDAEGAAQVSALPSSHGISDEGGIVRFNLGGRREGTGR